MTRRHLGRLAVLLGATSICSLLAPPQMEADNSAAPTFAALPDAIASFGAATEGDWLYVYGGHMGKTHTYSKQQVSPRFQRINLKTGGYWEELPSGPGLQGLVLLANGGQIYRIGGMTAKNEVGQPDDLHSLSTVARFDPATKKWTELTALPEGRSSHGAAIVDNKLYVVGGWCLEGAGRNGRWGLNTLVLDLKAEKPEWKALPNPPLERRAMMVTSCEDKLYVTGGLMSKGGISKEVDVFDTRTQKWTKGPEIPGMVMNGNGLAACQAEKSLYVSGMDGKVYRLNEAKGSWDVAGQLTPARIHHRLVPFRQGTVLAVAGASMQGHLKSVDIVQLDAKP